MQQPAEQSAECATLTAETMERFRFATHLLLHPASLTGLVRLEGGEAS